MDSKFTVYDSQGELDLRQIANSGQCFRLKEYATDKFIAVTGSHAVDIHRRGDVYIFWCDAKEFQAVWAPYFDLDTDYKGFKSKMSYSEKDLETFQKNVLKPEDTFHFECEMCGRCCRNRQEPILITGADLYRIARALDITMMKAVEDNTAGYIGETSHMPVLVLKERLDGSCRLLRKGRCMVHQDKPAVCALYPLGRFYDFRDNSFHYFVNPVTCQPNRKDGKVWTLQEWLGEFKIEETEKMTQAWNRLIGGLTMVTHKMSQDKINGRLLDVLLSALYFSYDTNKPYIEQVEQHMAMLPDVFKNEFGKVLKFDQA